MEKFQVYGPVISEKNDCRVFKVRIKESLEFVVLKSFKKDKLRALQKAVKIRCELKVGLRVLCLVNSFILCQLIVLWSGSRGTLF